MFAALVVLGGGLLLARAFAGIDLAATLRAVSRSGPLTPIALVPFLGSMALDAAGMTLLLRPLGRSLSFLQIFPVRIATEALHVTAPAGFLVADSMTATLLDSRAGVPLQEGAVLAVARKWLVMRAHGAYIVLGAASGAAVLASLSERCFGGPWLPWAVGGAALLPLGLSIGLGAGFRGRSALARLHDVLGRLPWPALRARVGRWRSGAVEVDAHLGRIGAARAITWLAALSFFGCWLGEALDTAVIVRLVGGPFDFAFAMAAEVGISLLRSVGNVAPAGLGVQDAGYATLFPALGLPVETTAAFVLLKRGKELVWIAAGYALLAALRQTRAATSVAPVSRLGVWHVEPVADAAYAPDVPRRVAELLPEALDVGVHRSRRDPALVAPDVA